ncbi:MAG: MarR family transcriptional regulator [Streptomycetaceae bacterium]|jgi:hypothetical protein|nr:MarR family transcriptional regulator [Streptomycetaceae bacterium]
MSETHGGWTFLTNHARVLAAVARNPHARVRDIAAECRLTERTVQAIITDLEQDGYLTRTRTGRRNTYRVVPGTRLRHPADRGRPVDHTLDLSPEPGTNGDGPGNGAAAATREVPNADAPSERG